MRLVRMQSKPELPCSWCINGYNHFGKLLGNLYIPYGLAILLPGINSTEMYHMFIQKCTRIFIDVHFINVLNKILLKYPPIVKKMEEIIGYLHNETLSDNEKKAIYTYRQQ